jgi:hypothetical protein
MHRMMVGGGLIAALALVLAGCASSPRRAPAHSVGPPATSVAAAAAVPPADSPLASCANPTPIRPKPIDTAVAGDFAGDRVRTTLTLDEGAFLAAPPPRDARPAISAGLAYCNLLAGATTNNASVVEAADVHGLSFGLADVTIPLSMVKTGPQPYLVGGRPHTMTLAAYNRRLAWVAIVEPVMVASCPTQPNNSSSAPSAPLPGYQIMIIDADTGSDGVIYSSRTNNICNVAGYTSPGIVPSAEFVSLPWTVVHLGPGPKSATITYQARSCDLRNLNTFGPTGQPVVMPTQDSPALVTISLDRILTRCGPPQPVTVLLRSATLTTDLPHHLLHAPVGAQDLPE